MQNFRIQLFTFGQIADHLKSGPYLVEGFSGTDGLKQRLLSDYDALSNIRFSVSVNRKIVHQDTPLSEGDEVALLPPFSGG